MNIFIAVTIYILCLGLFGFACHARATRLFTEDPGVGEMWYPRNAPPKNPFHPETTKYVVVEEVREGWVQYRIPKPPFLKLELETRYFKQLYTRNER